MDPKCVNAVNKLKYNLVNKNKKICKENKELEQVIKYYEDLERTRADYFFFLNGDTPLLYYLSENTYAILIPNEDSNSKIFTDIPTHVTANLGDINMFRQIVKSTTSEEIEEILGEETINSYDEPIKSLFQNYSLFDDIVSQKLSSAISLVQFDGSPQNNISELIGATGDENSTILIFKATGDIPRPPEGFYEQLSITIIDFYYRPFLLIGDNSASRFLYRIKSLKA